MMDANMHNTTRHSLSARLEELRSGVPQSPPNERAYSGYTTPSRYSGSFLPQQNHSSAIPGPPDARTSLQRRFTTSSDAPVNNWFSMGAPTPPNVDPKDISAAAFSMYKIAEQQKKPYERQSDIDILRQKKIDFERELEKFTQRQARDIQQLEHMARELKLGSSGGGQGNTSEPSTPPSERNLDYGFPSIYSRHTRYSSSGIMSPPANANRMSRSGSMMTSPPHDSGESGQSGAAASDKLPSKSVPGSRRGSNDRMSAYFAAAEMAAPAQRPATHSNRYSMPVASSTNMKRPSTMDDSHVLDHLNTTKFLFDDDDEKAGIREETVTSPGGKTYLQMQKTEDNFPILLRHTEAPRPATSSQAALDLAGERSSSPNSGWPTFPRHRAGQQSLPQNLFDPEYSSPPPSSRASMEITTPPSFNSRPNRHSMEASIASGSKNLFGRSETVSSSRPGLNNMGPSYSTNDLPTVKNPLSAKSPNSKSSAEEAFHKHNASLGRIPPGAVSRASRDLTSIASKLQETPKDDRQKQSPIQVGTVAATSAQFGPSIAATMAMDAMAGPAPNGVMSQFANPAYYGAYGMQMMNMQMMPGANGFTNQMYPYQAQGQYPFFPPAAQAASMQNGQNRNGANRRAQNGGDDGSRFSHARIENYQGEIYNLCKDQHGCRYLQRQLETRDADITRMIFQETHQHVVELMTDPFGNYLCQKLLEHANDEQRTVLVNNAAPQMVKIALNQHGTRALQKMIEFITTDEQTQTIINALRDKVVTLIQDLNGNHVIQKCLNRLSAEDAQFIFNAVGTNCVVVGTHRHGCCVLQRCIDHASSHQRAELIAHITQSAYALVRDPFGNYVLQYIIDLKDPRFINPLVTGFQGHVVPLSKHKFSSNVIEKMLRGADQSVSASMVNEMLAVPGDLESMLKDQYANYVVQTALDYSEPDLRQRLVESIRPVLPSIRQTPYGRRIQSKITASEQAMGIGSSSRSTASSESSQRTSLTLQPENLLNSPQRQSSSSSGSIFSTGAPAFAPSVGNPFALNGLNSTLAANGIGGLGSMNSMAANNIAMAANGKSNGNTPYNPFEVSNGNGQQQTSQQTFPGPFNQNNQSNGFSFF